MLRHGLISPHSEMREEREKLKKELLSKKEPKLADLKNSQTVHIVKNQKVCYGDNIKVVARHPLRDYGPVIYGSVKLSQQQ